MIRTTTAALTAAALLAVAGPAAAAAPKIDLVVSYMADAGYATAVVLTCNPVGGVHPKAAAACTALKKVGGRPDRLQPARTLCTLEYAPITAQITGTWKGRTMRWARKFPNHCDLTRSTGVVFAF